MQKMYIPQIKKREMTFIIQRTGKIQKNPLTGIPDS
jgi:hypothetical protein